MSVVRKLKLCTSENFTAKDGNEKRAYYRIGQLIEFMDDESGKKYFRAKLSFLPNTIIYVYPEDEREKESSVSGS